MGEFKAQDLINTAWATTGEEALLLDLLDPISVLDMIEVQGGSPQLMRYETGSTLHGEEPFTNTKNSQSHRGELFITMN